MEFNPRLQTLATPKKQFPAGPVRFQFHVLPARSSGKSGKNSDPIIAGINKKLA